MVIKLNRGLAERIQLLVTLRENIFQKFKCQYPIFIGYLDQ